MRGIPAARFGEDVIWTDESGYFNLTLKGSNDASDYFDEEGHDYFWEILRLVNQERENENLSPLTLSEGLTYPASVRADEIVELFEHTRPDGSSCFTAIEKDYWSNGENIAAGQTSPEKVMTAWMNPKGTAQIFCRKVSKNSASATPMIQARIIEITGCKCSAAV